MYAACHLQRVWINLLKKRITTSQLLPMFFHYVGQQEVKHSLPQRKYRLIYVEFVLNFFISFSVGPLPRPSVPRFSERLFHPQHITLLRPLWMAALLSNVRTLPRLSVTPKSDTDEFYPLVFIKDADIKRDQLLRNTTCTWLSLRLAIDSEQDCPVFHLSCFLSV